MMKSRYCFFFVLTSDLQVTWYIFCQFIFRVFSDATSLRPSISPSKNNEIFLLPKTCPLFNISIIWISCFRDLGFGSLRTIQEIWYIFCQQRFIYHRQLRYHFLFTPHPKRTTLCSKNTVYLNCDYMTLLYFLLYFNCSQNYDTVKIPQY
jgi:hypothetical protein